MTDNPDGRHTRSRRRDAALRATRRATRAAAAGAGAPAALFSAVAAHGFRGPPHRTPATAAPPSPAVRVPGPQHVPAIPAASGLQPPPAPPAPATPAAPPPPPPVSSGGS